MRDWVWSKQITPQSMYEFTLEEGGITLKRNFVDGILYVLQIKQRFLPPPPFLSIVLKD